MRKGIILKLILILILLSGIWYATDNYTFQLIVKPKVKALSIVSATSTSAQSGGFLTGAFGSVSKKVNILIVPGHEPSDGGTNFGHLYERDLVVTIGQDLQQFLSTSSNYQSFITRDTQAWNPTFADYFKNDWDAIVAWEQSSKQSALALANPTQDADPEIHNNTTDVDVALRLYGIVKWSNENNINLMIHMHLNNYPGSPKTTAGKYSGLVMYMPASKYDNSAATKPIATAMFKRLSLYNPISNLPVESAGLIEDPELIALGANNTSNAASILIEYDYIYEPQFVSPQVRDVALKDLAYQTYLGLQDYYNQNTDVTATSSYNPSANVYAWTAPVTSVDSNPDDIYALQTALIMDGDYPPVNKTKNDCPHSGTFGSCTRLAVEAFQQKNNLTGESVFGSKTFNLLNNIYNSKSN